MTHNYYLYGDPEDDGRLTWIPWDFNEGWWAGQGGMRDAIEVDLSDVSSGWPLLEKLAADSVYRAQYEDEVSELLTSAFDAASAEARIEANRARIAEWAAAEVAPYTAQTVDFDAATDELTSHLLSQRAAAQDVLH